MQGGASFKESLETTALIYLKLTLWNLFSPALIASGLM